MIENIEEKIDEDIVFALLSGKVTNAINRTLGIHLRQAGIEITSAQVSVLYCLWQKDGLTQKELSDRTAKDKPSITRILDAMDAQNLIFRKQHKDDRRSNCVFLTERGIAIKKQVRDATDSALQSGFRGLSSDDVVMVQNLMKHIYINLCNSGSGSDDGCHQAGES